MHTASSVNDSEGPLAFNRPAAEATLRGLTFNAFWTALAGLFDRMAARRTGLTGAGRRLDVVIGRHGDERIGVAQFRRRPLRFVFAPVIFWPVDGALLDGAADFALRTAALRTGIQGPASSILFYFNNNKKKNDPVLKKLRVSCPS